MMPVLPAEEVRAAVAEERWGLATALLEAHQREMVTGLAHAQLAGEAAQPWRALLATQRELIVELRAAQDAVLAAAEAAAREHRGARAWRRELA